MLAFKQSESQPGSIVNSSPAAVARYADVCTRRRGQCHGFVYNTSLDSDDGDTKMTAAGWCLKVMIGVDGLYNYQRVYIADGKQH